MNLEQVTALGPPEGTTTVTSATAIRGSANVGVRIDQYDRVAETNERNNFLSKALVCGGQILEGPGLVPLGPTAGGAQGPRGPRPDLVVTDLALDRSCRVFITLENRGPGSLPASASTSARPSYQMYRGTQGFGGSLLTPDQIGTLSPPGAELRIRTGRTVTGSVEIRGVVDASGRVPEANERNNSFTKTLVCPGKPLPKAMPVQPRSSNPSSTGS